MNLKVIIQNIKVIYLYIQRLVGLYVSHEEMYLEKLKINAYKGDPKAQYEYGLIIIRAKPYLTKYIDVVIIDGSIARNAREALEFVKNAANQGHEEARYALGEIYEKGTSEIAADEREALIWYEKAGYQGHPKAQIKLIEMYKEGRGTRKDIQQSQEWEERAEKNERQGSEMKIAKAERRSIEATMKLAEEVERTLERDKNAGKCVNTVFEKMLEDLYKKLADRFREKIEMKKYVGEDPTEEEETSERSYRNKEIAVRKRREAREAKME